MISRQHVYCNEVHSKRNSGMVRKMQILHVKCMLKCLNEKLKQVRNDFSLLSIMTAVLAPFRCFEEQFKTTCLTGRSPRSCRLSPLDVTRWQVVMHGNWMVNALPNPIAFCANGVMAIQSGLHAFPVCVFCLLHMIKQKHTSYSDGNEGAAFLHM